jgi:putative oxidoreductase
MANSSISGTNPHGLGICAYFCFASLVNAADFGLLVLRLALGLMLMAHGYNKVKGGLDGTGRWFESLGMHPGWFHARLAAGTELGAGLLFAVGLLTPAAAAGIIGVMLVAALTDHRGKGFFIFRKEQGWEYVMIIGVAAFAVACIGAGTASIDHAVGLDVEGWWGAGIAGIGGVGAAALVLALCYRPAPTRAKAT